MPSRDTGLLKRFLEELAVSLDIQKTIKKLDIAEDRARSMLRGLLPVEKKAAAHKDLFDVGHTHPGKGAGNGKLAGKGGGKGAGHGAKPAGQRGVRHSGFCVINVDGASRGNPGEAGAGAVIKDPEGRVLKRLKKYLGTTTNNMAEYQALVMALEAARSLKLERIRVLADSELMVKQINRVYRVKSPGLKPLYDRARALLAGFSKDSRVSHVYREQNGEADSLANEAIDGSR